jgi:hypothetical protein
MKRCIHLGESVLSDNLSQVNPHDTELSIGVLLMLNKVNDIH